MSAATPHSKPHGKSTPAGKPAGKPAAAGAAPTGQHDGGQHHGGQDNGADKPGVWRRWRDRKKPRNLPPRPRPDSIEGQVSDIYDRFVTRSNAEVNGMWEMLGSRKRLVWLNFLAGLSRGVGFFLGVTLVGGLVIGGTALVLDTTAEALGWKQVTFASMVQSMYGKFQEVRNVIDSMESKDALVETLNEPPPIRAPALRTPLEDAFPTIKYPFQFEDGPLPGKPPPLDKPPGLSQPPMSGQPR